MNLGNGTTEWSRALFAEMLQLTLNRLQDRCGAANAV
jgi:hypothetical protein